MNFKRLYVVPVAVALGVLSQANAAEAIVLGVGDILNITNGVDVQKTDTSQELFLFNNLETPPVAQPVGSYGLFGIQNDSTGGFENFQNSGTVVSDYQILSVDFADLSTYLHKSFLKAALPGTDAFTFEITTAADGDIEDVLVFGAVVGFKSFYSFGGMFKNMEGQVVAQGVGILTAQGGLGQDDSYSASFLVTETERVPEPTTTLALISVIGVLGLRRRSQPTTAN